MDFVKSPCIPLVLLKSPWNIFIGLEILLFAVFLFFIYWVFKTTKKTSSRIFLLAGFFVIFILSSLVNGVLYLFISEGYYASAGTYFALNAAVKNTCYLDKEKKNCPTTLEELINLDKEQFLPLIKDKKVKYTYYPNTNEYTLIIVPNDHSAVIFDPRLRKLQKSSYDFIVSESYSCEGRQKILNPPPLIDLSKDW